MISRIHAKLGSVGLIVAVVALIAALAGTAFAAAGLSGKQKQEVKKIAKKVAKPGPQGPAGLQGPKGDAGPKGDTGASGKDGADGVDGEDGACSVSVPKCVLPSGATETGQWGITATEVGPIVQISFGLRVEPAPIAEYLEGEPSTWTTVQKERCPGTSADPKAAAGFLCIYKDRGPLTFSTFNLTVDPSSGWLGEFSNSGGEGWVVGSWAVTAAAS